MPLTTTLRASALSVLRSPWLIDAVGGRTRGLRVLAYHTVADGASLAAQLEWLVARYEPVGAPAVHAAIRGDVDLPDRAVWVTFDDGDPSVVRNGLAALRHHDVPATMFVCPGLIERGEPSWWGRVAAAGTVPLTELTGRTYSSLDDALEHLKRIPDPDRRQIVAQLPAPTGPDGSQLTDGEIDQWLAAGQDIGNHTWDHPCLDRCSEEEQRRQVVLADDWLRRRIDGWLPTFAYPNGNWSAPVEELLRDRDYAIGVLHDHRMATSLDRPLTMSRLHVDADDGVPRFSSIVAGVQPALHHAAGRVRRAPAALRRRSDVVQDDGSSRH